jgi:MFS family permease
MSIHSSDESDAQRPLLGEQRERLPKEASHSRFSDNERQKFLLVMCAIILLLDLGDLMSNASRLEILEDIICQSVRDGRSPASSDDTLCQSAAVQGQLAMLIAWKETLDMLPTIALAVPYGYLSDRVGRKPVLMLALIGLVLEGIAFRAICWFNASIPIHAIWATPLIQIAGGGTVVASSIILAMVVDMYDATSR